MSKPVNTNTNDSHPLPLTPTSTCSNTTPLNNSMASGELLVSYFQSHPTDFYPTLHGHNNIHQQQASYSQQMSSHEALFSQPSELSVGLSLKQHRHAKDQEQLSSDDFIDAHDMDNDAESLAKRVKRESVDDDPMDSSSSESEDDQPFTPILQQTPTGAPVFQVPLSISTPNLPMQQQGFSPQLSSATTTLAHHTLPTLPYLQGDPQPQSIDDQLWQQMFLPVLDPYQQLQVQQLQMQQQNNHQNHLQQLQLQQQQFPFTAPSTSNAPQAQFVQHQQLQHQLHQQLQQQYHLQQQLHHELQQQKLHQQQQAQLAQTQQHHLQLAQAKLQYKQQQAQQQQQYKNFKHKSQLERTESYDSASSKSQIRSRLQEKLQTRQQIQQDLHLEIPDSKEEFKLEPKDEVKVKAERKSPTSQVQSSTQSPKPARPIHFHTVQTPQRIQHRQNQQQFQLQQQQNPVPTAATSAPRPIPIPESTQAVAHMRKKPMKENERLLVIEPEVLCLRQGDAAKRLMQDMKPSTLSKRWKTSLPNRVWPYRAAKKLQKQIVSLQDLEVKGFNVRSELEQLTNIRKATLDPAVIVINDKLEDSIRSYTNDSESLSPDSSPAMTPPTLMIPNMFSASGTLSSSTGALPPFTPPIFPPSSSFNTVERPPSST